MKNVALHNLGCKVNAYEMDFIQQNLLKKGYNVVPFDEYADIYIVNTCTVTNIADRKSRQMLHRCKQLNPKAVVVALGCYVQTDSRGVIKDPDIDIAIGNNNKSKAIEIIEEYLDGKAGEKVDCIIDINDVKNPCPYESMSIEKTIEHSRAYIKIQDGCNQFCTYCIIPYARGRVRSRRQEEILDEIKTLSSNGYKEVVLTGIHIGSYGMDFKDGSDLISLLEEIDKVPGIERVRISSLEPGTMTKEFIERLKNLKKICPHFHLSLQSGCDSVLKRMNRKYKTADFMASVDNLRKAFDRPAITTDVIAGFPGETEEEFGETADFIKKIGFYEIHLFPYSRRHGTVADKMEGQLTRKEKTDRVKRLSEIEREMTRAYEESFIGAKVSVLFEEPKEIKGKTYMIGHTDRYLTVALKSDKDLKNTIKEVKLSGFLTDGIMAAEEA
ncbi:MAG: tRNA (N(6)-L-threonylcarbamoyladenosine(37)-C(2))-methylthiotransferase MtaB [Lachnospiraceae bacterium]|nr:tRNA (N(6)-L-threonylcarbamoyladenosine(37)-C(2))-methylthiotransferase MtaB [Lachnospiraceae bacterium]